jgi:hypothetical protein
MSVFLNLFSRFSWNYLPEIRMPATLDTPVFTIDVGLIHKVDTRNVENLFSMWTGELPGLGRAAVLTRN